MGYIYKTLAKQCIKLMEINEKEESSSSSDSELSDKAYSKALNKLSALRNNKEGEPIEEDEEDTMGKEEKSGSESSSGSDIEIDTDEDDPEIKGASSDFRLYYSPLDMVHELYYVKEKIEEIARKDIGLYKQLEGVLNEEEKKKFAESMTKAIEYQKKTIEEFQEDAPKA